jgi:hypothetical protein
MQKNFELLALMPKSSSLPLFALLRVAIIGQSTVALADQRLEMQLEGLEK